MTEIGINPAARGLRRNVYSQLIVCPEDPELWGFERWRLCRFLYGFVTYVPYLTGGACCFRWVSRLGAYRDRTALVNITNVVYIYF